MEPSQTTTLPFTQIYTLLTSYHQSNSSLSLPLSHPTTQSILDILSSLGIEEILQHRWEENYRKLREYKRIHGNCCVDTNDDLMEWTVLQRECYRNYEQQPQPQEEQRNNERLPNVTTERYFKLKNVGLTVNRWERRLMELKRHKLERGHCDVPIDYPGGLGIWCTTQRETYKFERDTMPKERIDALDALGFSWSRWGRNRSQSRKDAWEKMFHELIEYKNANGDCNISQYDESNKQLGKWAKNQRYEYRRYHTKGLGQSRISRDRIDKLESIGFQWRLKPEKVSWEKRFEQLKRYKDETGHCRPPHNHPDIGSWVKYQRSQLQCYLEGKTTKIDQEKADKLLSIGFNDASPSRSEQVEDILLPNMVDNHSLLDPQRIQIRRTPSSKRTPDHNPIQETPNNPAHHPQYAFPSHPDSHYPHYEFDSNVTAASLDHFYPPYDPPPPQGTPLLSEGPYGQGGGQVYPSQYEKYNYPTGV